MIVFIENKIRGGFSSAMCDRYVKSDEMKKNIYIDAFNIYGFSMSQPLPYDEIEKWHGHPDLYTKKSETLKTPDDSDIGYFVEDNLNYPDEKKKKQRFFHSVLQINYVIKMISVFI